MSQFQFVKLRLCFSIFQRLILCVCASVYVSKHIICVGACQSQKRTLDPLELELQMCAMI